MSSVRRGSVCGVVLSVMMCCGIATAQEDVKLVAMEDLPGQAESLVALDSGDVILLEPVAAQRYARPMTRLTTAGGMYQLDPVVFGNPGWASLKLDHVTQGSDKTLWAAGEDSVVYQRDGEAWEMIQLPELSRRSCKSWGKFGVPCQMIVPVGDGRAVTLRPVMQRGQIGTEVYALEQGELRPLGSVVLPGVALGPVVKDGAGGFWVMLRRTVQTSNFKPMRGYLHYTAAGEWKMWSDSGEMVEGTDFMGKTKFLIDPDVRKMAPDGQGGFFALGQDRVLYLVDEDGKSTRFSDAQPACQYCQPLAIAYDEAADTLNMVMGEWREGEAGAVEVLGPTRWLEFNARTGSLLLDEVVPTPEVDTRAQREFFTEVVISAAREGKWLSAPGMLLHRSRSGWSLMSPPEVLKKQEDMAQARERLASRNPALGKAALLGELALVVGGVGASALYLNSLDFGSNLSGDTGLQTGFYVPMLGALAGLYPAMYTVRYMEPAKQAESGRGLCLSLGLTSMFALNTLGVLIPGEVFAERRSISEDNQNAYGSMGIVGAAGGAAVGTMAGALLTNMVYQHSESTPNPAMTGFLMSAVGSSLSSLAYFLLAESWKPESDEAMMNTSPYRNNPLTF